MFIQEAHPENMLFYHNGGGQHGGAYYGVSSGKTGKIKIVDSNTYIPTLDDNAYIVRIGKMSDKYQVMKEERYKRFVFTLNQCGMFLVNDANESKHVFLKILILALGEILVMKI